MKQIPVKKKIVGSNNQYRNDAIFETIGYTTVDDEHFHELNQYTWTLNSSGYIQRWESKVVLMQNDIWQRLEKRSPTELDHIDRDKLNNQLNNFRPATRSQNLANKTMQRNNTTGFKGVSWHKLTGKYRASMQVNKKRMDLGYFTTAIEAAKAYDTAAVKHFGEFACTNKSMGLY